MDTKKRSDKLTTKLRELAEKPEGWGDMRIIEPTDARAILTALAPSDAAQAPLAPIQGYDLSTSAGGSGYLVEYFATRLRTHTYQRYIEERLAKDFACALSKHLSERDAAPVAPAAAAPSPGRQQGAEIAQSLVQQGATAGAEIQVSNLRNFEISQTCDATAQPDERAFQKWCDKFPEISEGERLRDAWNEARATQQATTGDERAERYRKALYQIAHWPCVGGADGQSKIEEYALSVLDGDPPIGELDPHDALRYMVCRASAIERGLFATPEEYDAMVDDSLRKKGKEVLTGRGNNYGKKVAKNGSLYREPASKGDERAVLYVNAICDAIFVMSREEQRNLRIEAANVLIEQLSDSQAKVEIEMTDDRYEAVIFAATKHLKDLAVRLQTEREIRALLSLTPSPVAGSAGQAPIGKVLSQAEMFAARMDGKAGNVIWFGSPEPGYIYATAPTAPSLTTDAGAVLTDEQRTLIWDATRSLSIRADELKESNTSLDGTWCDAEEQAQYEAEVRLIERLQDLYNAHATARMSDAATIERLRRALRPFADLVSTDTLSWANVEYCVQGDPEKQTFNRPQMQRAFNRAAAEYRDTVDAARNAEIERQGGEA
ncbi:hypothetical protein [Paraburkholderia tropica]|uniref:hypothetical protein n=1 Tax=Paraburkholderia tropica TaxID=92647 RepID=UPI002AB6C76B|nr:hypothetical protein [Paraburkholderia tropica]